MKKIAISVGDLNGIGLEIALKSHEEVKKICEPIYCINETMLQWGAALLKVDVPLDFATKECGGNFEITPGIVSKSAGEASFDSFITAVALAKSKVVDAIVTLPINKEAWSDAGLAYKGHTDALGDLLDEDDGIMMLGCDKLFTILFTHHIPLCEVSLHIKKKALASFLLRTYQSLQIENIGVLALNPHAGDGGVIGEEEDKIKKAIELANSALDKEVFFGPIVPDSAFTKKSLENCKYFVCMYHDQALIALKAMFFEESINVTLGLSIIRTSVDHGTAFDIAYKNANPSNISYINAIKEAIKLSEDKPILDF
ncbi:MAG: 4-hydroxythreonine-4-phosphate dehydrogenase [Campylobacteraceae bacterium]